MKIQSKDIINLWEESTTTLTKFFVHKYYGDDAEWHFVRDLIGDILYVNDDFYNMDRILEALRLNATYEQLMEYHEMEVEATQDNPPKYNFKNFVKYGKEQMEAITNG